MQFMYFQFSLKNLQSEDGAYKKTSKIHDKKRNIHLPHSKTDVLKHK